MLGNHFKYSFLHEIYKTLYVYDCVCLFCVMIRRFPPVGTPESTSPHYRAASLDGNHTDSPGFEGSEDMGENTGQ